MTMAPVAGIELKASTRLSPRVIAFGRWVVAIAGAVVIFGSVIVFKGANPVEVYRSMWTSLTTDTSITGILVKGAPLILAALAVAVPARAGLVNVGGEGQLLMGGIGATAVSLAIDGRMSGSLTMALMILAAMAGGALWAAVAGVLRLAVGINEAVTTLLLNYVALNLLYFLIYEPWKDPNGSGQPATRPLVVSERLPLLGTSKVHAGIAIAIVAAGVLWWALRSTRWGFKLRVVGGNPEAARRSGFKVGALLLSAMLVGGALAGLGGFVQLAGAEFKLRPGFLVTYGYVGFLASWLARHQPLKVAGAALVLGALSITGDSLQIDSQLPAATVNVLMALVLLAVFGFVGTSRNAT